MTELLFHLMFVFAVGSLAGWIIELFYRTFVSQKKLVNPGFLSGPYLPIYGFGLVALFLLSGIDVPAWQRIPFFFIATTVLEYLTGLFFLKCFNLRLWDYTERRLQIQGLICPRFSLYWTGLSTLFFYFLYPLLNSAYGAIEGTPLFFFGIGIYAGLLIKDIIVSFELAFRMKNLIKEAAEKEQARRKQLAAQLQAIDLKKFKVQLRNKSYEAKSGRRLFKYFNPFSDFQPRELAEQLDLHLDAMRENLQEKRRRRRPPRA